MYPGDDVGGGVSNTSSKTIGFYDHYHTHRPVPEIKPWGPEWVQQPWPDDGTGHGDYPNWYRWSYQDRDPHATYDDQQERRNYGEPVHVSDMGLDYLMPDSVTYEKYTPVQSMAYLGVFAAIFAFIIYFDTVIKPADGSWSPADPRPYPYNNLYIEVGGDPNREPDSYELTRRIQNPLMIFRGN